MAKYKSRRQYHSRLAKQESKRVNRQTFLIVLITIGLIIALIFVGIPALTKMALFIAELGNPEDISTQNDTIPPQTPQLSSTPEATNSGSLSLTGYSEQGATVSLFHNNQEKIKTVVDANGRFEFLEIDLSEGSNSFYAVAKDAAENSSQRSIIRTVAYDTKAPELTIETPEADSLIVGITRQNTKVAGTTEAGSKVMLNGRVVVVKSDGSFSTQHSLQDGDNELTLVSTDPAGNTTSKTIKLKYSKD